jgi:hypothetical protein
VRLKGILNPQHIQQIPNLQLVLIQINPLLLLSTNKRSRKEIFPKKQRLTTITSSSISIKVIILTRRIIRLPLLEPLRQIPQLNMAINKLAQLKDIFFDKKQGAALQVQLGIIHLQVGEQMCQLRVWSINW